jgi:hypothetical protein
VNRTGRPPVGIEIAALIEWFGERSAGAYAEHLLVRAPLVPEVIRG